jgi:hypothetical protein
MDGPESVHRIQVRVMMTADGAQAVNGKLYVLGGGFNQVSMPTVPFQHRFDLALLVEVPWTATNQPFRLVVEQLDADGEPLNYRAEATIEAGRPAGARQGTSLSIPIAVPVVADFPEPGRYVLRASIDGEERGRVALEAVKAPVAT